MGNKKRFKLIPEVYLILVREGKILLSRRFQTGYEDGKYSIVAGHAEEGEPLTQAMAREVREECGIELEPEKLSLKLVMHRKTDRQQVSFFFTTEEWKGESKNMEPNKCDDLSWFLIDELPANTIPYIRKAIEYYRQGVNYCEFGW